MYKDLLPLPADQVWTGVGFTGAAGSYTIAAAGYITTTLVLADPIYSFDSRVHLLMQFSASASILAQLALIEETTMITASNFTEDRLLCPFGGGNIYYEVIIVLTNKGLVDATISDITLGEYLPLQKIYGRNQEVAVDDHGLNPAFIKRFPNKILNSGFEVYDNLWKPIYWTGAGEVTPASNWEGTVALKLVTSEVIIQTAAAGVDPEWWEHKDTRYSFRYRGGGVIVRVKRVSDSALITITDNSNPHDVVSGTSLSYPSKLNWDGLVPTFYFTPIPADGPVVLEFECSGAEVYLDAVQIEPDFTGYYPSFYTSGPKQTRAIIVSTNEPDNSVGTEGDIWIVVEG